MDSCDFDGATPLGAAVSAGPPCLPLVRVLLEAGVDPTAETDVWDGVASPLDPA